MFISHADEISGKPMEGEGIDSVEKRVLAGPDQGWEDHVMRLFVLGPGGHTPKHRHPWSHFNYVVSGEGVLHHEGTDHPVRPGSVMVVPAKSLHQYRNAGEGEFRFICIVPLEGD